MVQARLASGAEDAGDCVGAGGTGQTGGSGGQALIVTRGTLSAKGGACGILCSALRAQDAICGTRGRRVGAAAALDTTGQNGVWAVCSDTAGLTSRICGEGVVASDAETTGAPADRCGTRGAGEAGVGAVGCGKRRNSNQKKILRTLDSSVLILSTALSSSSLALEAEHQT